MPTNDERREIANKLRRNAEAYPSMSIVLNMAFSDEYFKPNDVSMEYVVTSHDAAIRLADLVEPEPERTCHMIEIHDYCDEYEDFGIQCSSCGAFARGWKSRSRAVLGGKTDMPLPNFCENCGAKVVDE